MTTAINLPKVEFIYTPVANYAIQQNRIPIVRKLIIENPADEDLFDLTVAITGEPEFVNMWSNQIEVLPKNQSVEVEVKGLLLSANFLSELTEKLTGDLVLSIFKGEELVIKENYSVDILAYDQWNGIGVLPEMLAAFVTPNHPEIAKVLQKASMLLEDWTGNPSFDAYQSLNPDRVKKQMGAIFEVIARLGIVYCAPPASFENEGQRIRLCDTIFSQKLGTCIDMAILYASCIEAIGLNPLLIVINGHAFVGAWLLDEMFADGVNDDVTLLKKRIAKGINEIVLVEATSMNAGQFQTFDESINTANYKLVREEDFILFVDVKRARFSGIKPLPQRIKTSDGWEIVDEIKMIIRDNQVPNKIVHERNTEISESCEFTKQKLWERKLLDLSLRNNLLNLRISQRTIQLFSINLNKFEDALAEGNEFQVMQKPEEFYNPNKNSGVYQALNMSDPIVELLKYDLSHKRLRTYLTETELKFSLTKLYRASRLSIEENGANTLFIALGFLKWYETPRSELARYAPILLLPIEIVKKSAQKGFVIRSREEDTMVNITLLEMLKQDFDISIQGLDEIPRDESGVDVVKVFNIMRRGVMSQTRWDVEEHAFLGIFSFSKFIMWNDIHNNAKKLSENKIVDSLVSGKLKWESDGVSANIDFDNKYTPSDISLPISADSTQLEAILAASHDKSFILHGPPGTGKSQTITNIISNALYKGKRVLFVAEKMAALTVVQKRLANIGLDPFCLELHSNKSKKSSILEQLRKSTEVIRKTSPLEFISEAERLNQQRAELNGYVDALHKTYHFGFSLYDSFTGYAELNGASDKIQIEEKLIEGLTKEKFVFLCDLVEELQDAGTLCGHPHNNPLKEINTIEYSQQNKNVVKEKIPLYINVLEQKLENIKTICDLLGINDISLNKEKLKVFEQLMQVIVTLPDTPETLINIDYPDRSLGNIIELGEHGVKRDEYRNELLKEFSKNILIYDAESKLIEWKVVSDKWFLPRFFGQNQILKTLNSLSKSDRLGKDQVVSCLDRIILYQKEQVVIEENTEILSKEIGFLWNSGKCDWENLIEICVFCIKLNQLFLELIDDVLKVKEIRFNLSILLAGGSQTFKNSKGKILTSYLENCKCHEEIEEQLSLILKIDFENEVDSSEDWIRSWRGYAVNWLGNLDELRDWTSWNRVKEKVTESGITSVINSYSQGELNNEDVLVAFKKSLYKCFAEIIIAKDSRLSVFNGKLFESKIRKFKEQSNYFEELTKAELFAKLASNIPSFTQEASKSSEIGILQRAIRNKGRAMSIRRLFDLIPHLLPKMCPCMLMSPISVAQYFEVDKSKFDLVIFDEASQMPTCEAVGAIARGQNVIVVGDPKQMPPTNFFSTNHFDEENADLEDLESILDDCLALSMPSKHLLWHYRSKHESLIAFSNSNYYENKLLTFPSPDDIATKVNNVFVSGYYDRGKTRQNSFEAKAIVEEVMERLSDPVLSKKSIGIVTFSSVQQNLIEDLLNEAFKKNPIVEKVAMECSEPLFVKNLENVQGDERDVILFSVGYGPDKDGKIYLNFGPLNREGGWRRLNVAVSRARYEMKVYSTLRSDQIDISRTSSEGVAGIKAFLEYTEKGKVALPQKNFIKKVAPRYFEKQVADEIKKMGYSVEIDIGCSGYRVDIGIVNPEKTSEYILGIQTDGKTYRAAKTAKDREIVQTGVLKMLGWNIYKLWSLDWWENPKKILIDIDAKIKEALKQKEGALQMDLKNDYLDVKSEKNNQYGRMKLQGITQEVILPVKTYRDYETTLLDYTSLYSSDDFFEYSVKSKIIEQIKQIMEVEAPISHNLLSKRLLKSWGISRLGIRLNRYLSELYLRLELQKTKQNNICFYWLKEQDPTQWNTFRVPVEADPKRNADELPKEEVFCAIIDVLINQISLPEEELIREVARLFGYTRIGGNVEQAMRLGIGYGLKNRQITYENERIVLSGN